MIRQRYCQIAMTVVGIDWGSGHWIAVEIGTEISVDSFPSILNCWREYDDRADQMLIDIPIGLPDEDSELHEGRRICDHEAHQRLSGPLGSSVFTTPCRDAVYAETYSQARESNEDVLGRGLGSQSWSLVPRIQEVDIFLRDEDLDVRSKTEVRESHPEVCFNGLARSLGTEFGVTERKTTDKGIEQRKAVIGEYDSALLKRYNDLEAKLADDGTHGSWKHRITSTRLDDVLDAMALALAASRNEAQVESLPAERTVPEDRYGLPMEIVFPVE